MLASHVMPLLTHTFNNGLRFPLSEQLFTFGSLKHFRYVIPRDSFRLKGASEIRIKTPVHLILLKRHNKDSL